MQKRKFQSLALNAALLACSVVTILPFLWMLASSFKSNAEISALEQHFLPLHPSFDNYLNALEKMNFLRYFANSLTYAMLLTALTLYTSAISGFVLCKYRFRGRDALFGAILATMMVPGRGDDHPALYHDAAAGMAGHMESPARPQPVYAVRHLSDAPELCHCP